MLLIYCNSTEKVKFWFTNRTRSNTRRSYQIEHQIILSDNLHLIRSDIKWYWKHVCAMYQMLQNSS